MLEIACFNFRIRIPYFTCAQDPTKILSLNRSALNLLVRTFFVKVGEIEGFCNKYVCFYILMFYLWFFIGMLTVNSIYIQSCTLIVFSLLFLHYNTSPYLSPAQVLSVVRLSAAYRHYLCEQPQQQYVQLG